MSISIFLLLSQFLHEVRHIIHKKAISLCNINGIERKRERVGWWHKILVLSLERWLDNQLLDMLCFLEFNHLKNCFTTAFFGLPSINAIMSLEPSYAITIITHSALESHRTINIVKKKNFSGSYAKNEYLELSYSSEMSEILYSK